MKLSAFDYRALSRPVRMLPVILILVLCAAFVFFVTYLSGLYGLKNILRASAAFTALFIAALLSHAFKKPKFIRYILYLFIGTLIFFISAAFFYYYPMGLHVSPSDIKAILQSDPEETLEYLFSKILSVKLVFSSFFIAVSTCCALYLLGKSLIKKIAIRRKFFSIGPIVFFVIFYFSFTSTEVVRNIRFTIVEYYSFLHTFNRLHESAPCTQIDRANDSAIMILVLPGA